MLSIFGVIAFDSYRLISKLTRQWEAGECVVYGARLVEAERQTCEQHRRLTDTTTATHIPQPQSGGWLGGGTAGTLSSLPAGKGRRRLHRYCGHRHMETVYQPTFSVQVLGMGGPRVSACEHPSCRSGETNDMAYAGRIVDDILDRACTVVGYDDDNMGAWLTMHGGTEGLLCDPALLAGASGELPTETGNMTNMNSTIVPTLGERYCKCWPTYVLHATHHDKYPT